MSIHESAGQPVADADIINVPDTVGTATPEKMYDVISQSVSTVKIPISVHCHNDFGLAVANSLAGVRAGALQAHVTINGLGERAGNASLEVATGSARQRSLKDGRRRRLGQTLEPRPNSVSGPQTGRGHSRRNAGFTRHRRFGEPQQTGGTPH